MVAINLIPLTKTCTKCKKTLPLSAFNLKKGGKFGRRSDCKECRHKTEKVRSDKNKDKKAAYDAVYREENRDKRVLFDKEYYATHKEQSKAYAQSHREQINQWARENSAKNPTARIANILRTLLRTALKGQTKNGSAVRDLGCSLKSLGEGLEFMFWPGMNKANDALVKWHVDHLVPLSAFDLTDREELLIACHYSNLQPLWEDDNKSKNARLNWTPAESKHPLPDWIKNDPGAYQRRVDFVLDKLSKVRLKEAA
jgi:hypothetical protein